MNRSIAFGALLAVACVEDPATKMTAADPPPEDTPPVDDVQEDEDTSPPADTSPPEDSGTAEDSGDPPAPAPAVVSVQVDDALAHEDGAEPARFRIVLDAAREDDLTVPFTLGGSASADDDFTLTIDETPAEASITIPAGSTERTLTLTPVASPTMEPTESVTLTVTATDALRPADDAATAEATIVEHGPSNGATYYVAVDGDDTAAGDETAPFGSLAHAMSVLAAGDTLYIRDGVHTASNYVADHGTTGDTGIRHGILAKLDASGEAGNWIRIAAEPDGNDARPVLRFDGSGGLQLGAGVSHVVVEGLEVEGHNAEITYEQAMAHRWSKENYYTGRGIFTWGPAHHIVVRDNVVHHTPGSGIRFNNSDYILVENNVVSNTTWWSSSAESGVVIATAQSIDTEEIVKILYSGNVVYNNWNLLEFCSNDFVGSEADAYGNCDHYTGGIIDGQGLYVTRNNDTYTHGRMRFENNIAFNNGFGGVVYHKTDRGELANNLVFMNGAYPGVTNYSGLTLNTANDVVIVNNLVWSRDDDDFGVKENGPTSDVVTGHNYVVGRTQLLDETVDVVVGYDEAPALLDLFANAVDIASLRPDPHGTGSGIAPAEVDGLLTELGLDFQLLSTATALVDMGTGSHAPGADRLGVVRPQGTAVDVGPHEVVPE